MSADDLWAITAESRQARENAESIRARYLADLSFTASDKRGFRFLLLLLQSLGAEKALPDREPQTIAWRNLAESLLRDLAEINPKAALKLIASLRGMDGESNG